MLMREPPVTDRIPTCENEFEAVTLLGCFERLTFGLELSFSSGTTGYCPAEFPAPSEAETPTPFASLLLLLLPGCDLARAPSLASRLFRICPRLEPE